MPRYMEIAKQAQSVVDSVMLTLKDHPEKEFILPQLLFLYNLGIRTAPRATQSTVRLNAVVEAGRNQPVNTKLVTRTGKGYKGDYTYKAISIQVTTNPSASVEDSSTDTDD